MEPRKQMSRKAYKKTLGLFFLLTLIILDLLFLYLSNVFRGIALKGLEVVCVPLTPLWLASIATFLVWAFLRLAVPLEPLTDEQRDRPLLQRLNYLQLVAVSGTLIGIIWGISLIFTGNFLTYAIQISEWEAACIFIAHPLTTVLAATMLYIGSRTRRIVITLLCFLLFIVTIALNWFGVITASDVFYNSSNRYEESASDEYTDAHDSVTEAEDTTDDTQEWEERDDEPGLLDEAGTSLVHYCYEYLQDKTTNTTLCFTDRLLMDYYAIQQEKPDETYAGKSFQWLDEKKWIDAGDCYRLYMLASMIFGHTDLNEDEVYEFMCEQVLPVIVQGLNDQNLYPGSQLETLINLLDYAYRDLQSPGDEKLSALYSEMASDDFLHLEAADLYPYFKQPYAVLHSASDDTQVIWAYSFWARRWNDGNIGLCRRILDKILETWPNTTCTSAILDQTEQYYRANRRNRNYSREELLQELENAFAGAPRPAVQTILINEMEIDRLAEMGKIFSRYTWQEIPAAMLCQNAEALSCFTPEGFRYYLPAFLSEMIRNDNPEKDLYAPLLRSLTYSRMSPEYGWNHFAAFSSEQGKAVCHCLEWMAANRHDGSVPSSQLQHAAESWWLRYE